MKQCQKIVYLQTKINVNFVQGWTYFRITVYINSELQLQGVWNGFRIFMFTEYIEIQKRSEAA